MATTSNSPIALARNHNREIVMGMAITVADGPAINDHAMIKQRAVTFLNGFHPIQKMSKKSGMVTIDLRKCGDLARSVTMMRQTVMTVLYSEVGIAAIIAIIRK